MRTLRILIVVVLAVWLQMALRNVLVLGTAPLDIVLVAVVYIALTSGPTAGLLAGVFLFRLSASSSRSTLARLSIALDRPAS